MFGEKEEDTDSLEVLLNFSQPNGLRQASTSRFLGNRLGSEVIA
jgi:hypothetical protein